MDVEKAIKTRIEPELLEALGLSATKSLLTTATLAYVLTVGGEIQRYHAFVDSLCTNELVIRQWGEGGAAKRAHLWKSLVPLEPEPIIIVGATPRG